MSMYQQQMANVTNNMSNVMGQSHNNNDRFSNGGQYQHQQVPTTIVTATTTANTSSHQVDHTDNGVSSLYYFLRLLCRYCCIGAIP